MLLLADCCCDFCYDVKEIFELVAFRLNILALFVMLLLFRTILYVFQLIVGGNVQMNIFLETIDLIDCQNLEEVYFVKGQN